MHICCPGKVDASDNKRKNMSQIPGSKGRILKGKRDGDWFALHYARLNLFTYNTRLDMD